MKPVVCTGTWAVSVPMENTARRNATVHPTPRTTDNTTSSVVLCVGLVAGFVPISHKFHKRICGYNVYNFFSYILGLCGGKFYSVRWPRSNFGAPRTRAAAATSSVQFRVSELANSNLTNLVYEEWIGVERLVGIDGYCAYNYQSATCTECW